MVEAENKTLYERLGGAPAIDLCVDKFYDKVLSDPVVKDFFQETNMAFQRQHQKNFITMVTGGPKTYSGKKMREAHSHLELNDEHFDKIKELLSATLRELGVDEKGVKEVMDLVETTREDVLNR